MLVARDSVDVKNSKSIKSNHGQEERANWLSRFHVCMCTTCHVIHVTLGLNTPPEARELDFSNEILVLKALQRLRETISDDIVRWRIFDFDNAPGNGLT